MNIYVKEKKKILYDHICEGIAKEYSICSLTPIKIY